MTPLDLARLDIRLFELRMSRMSADDLNDPYVVTLYAEAREWERQVRRVCRPKRRSRPAPAPPATSSKYLTARQAAEYLGLTHGSFRNIAVLVKRTKHGRYTRDALDRFAAGGAMKRKRKGS